MKCVKHIFYRPVGRLQTSESACIPCDCHGPGVLAASPETGLTGDCVDKQRQNSSGWNGKRALLFKIKNCLQKFI